LRSKHDGCEQGEQETLKQKEEYEDHCGRGTVCCAVLPVSVDTSNEVMYAKKQTVIGDKANVEGEEDEKFLVLLSNTIVHPGTMVVHLFDTSLANRAVMCPFWLDATALGAFEDHLPFLKPHSLDVLFGGISFRYSSRICEHCAQVRADSKESKALEYQPVDYAEHFVGVGVQDHAEDNKLGIQDEKPREEDAKKATNISYAPKLPPHTPILIVEGSLHLALKLSVEIQLN